MSRRRREALREFTAEEQHTLTQFARSQRVPAIQSRRAGVLLEVASGKSLLEASRSQGFKDGDTASSLVHRFNLARCLDSSACGWTCGGIRRRGTKTHLGFGLESPRSRAPWHEHLVLNHAASGVA